MNTLPCSLRTLKLTEPREDTGRVSTARVGQWAAGVTRESVSFHVSERQIVMCAHQEVLPQIRWLLALRSRTSDGLEVSGWIKPEHMTVLQRRTRSTGIQDRGIITVWGKNYCEGLPGTKVRLRRSSNNEWNFQSGVHTVTS